MVKIHEMIEKYKEFASSHGKFTISGDSVNCNKSYKDLIKAAKAIFAFGENGKIEFLSLLKDEDDSVRLWAATHSLSFNKVSAEDTLSNLAKSDSFFNFSAEMVLSEWHSGRLKINLE